MCYWMLILTHFVFPVLYCYVLILPCVLSFSMSLSCVIHVPARTTSHLQRSMMIIRFFMKRSHPMNRTWSSHMRLIQRGVTRCCRMCHHCLLCGKCSSRWSACISNVLVIGMGRRHSRSRRDWYLVLMRPSPSKTEMLVLQAETKCL